MGQDGCLPTKGTVFISVKEKDKPHAVDIARTLHELGFRIMATRGTASAISREGLPVQEVLKVFEGSPNVVDYLKRGEINLVINTTEGNVTEKDSFPIRRTALVPHPLLYNPLWRNGGRPGNRGHAERADRGPAAAGILLGTGRDRVVSRGGRLRVIALTFTSRPLQNHNLRPLKGFKCHSRRSINCHSCGSPPEEDLPTGHDLWHGSNATSAA